LVPLNGNGSVTTVLGVSPSQLSFASTLIGQASAAQTVTVTNKGSFAATSLTLALAAPFSLTQDTCGGNSLAAGASCTAGVIFTPTAGGTATGTLTVGSASVLTPATVALSGAGGAAFDFTVTISGASSQTVASGQTANYSLVITPANGQAGTFTLQSGTLPANAICLFNPSSTIQISAGATGTPTARIYTGVTGAVRMERPGRWRALPLVCGLALLPLAWRRRRKVLPMAALLAIIAGGVCSCTSSGGGSSGGSGGQGGSGSTPAGTYSIPLTVVSGNVQHSVTVTLIVD